MLCYTVYGVRGSRSCSMNINAASDKQVKWKALNLFGFTQIDRVDVLSPNLLLATSPRKLKIAGA